MTEWQDTSSLSMWWWDDNTVNLRLLIWLLSKHEQAACECTCGWTHLRLLRGEVFVSPAGCGQRPRGPVGQMWKRWDLAARLALKVWVWIMRESSMPSISLPWTKGCTSKLFDQQQGTFLVHCVDKAQVRCQAVYIVLWEPGDWDWNR